MAEIDLCLLNEFQFSSPTQTEAETTPQARTPHSLFRSFFGGIKQDTATTTVYIKPIIDFLNQHSIVYARLSKIWENTYGCADHYRYSTALYPMKNISQYFSVIIYHGISAPVHGL